MIGFGDRPPKPHSLLWAIGLAVLSWATLDSASQAFDPEDFGQLLQELSCPNCDLSGADLRFLDLTGANLEQANLTGANFYRSTLDDADLSGADLSRAYLADVSAIDANFNSAKFNEATLYNSDFTGADFYRTLFGDAYIEKSTFTNALLITADMSEVISVSNDFEDALLCGAEMVYGDYRYQCLEAEE